MQMQRNTGNITVSIIILILLVNATFIFGQAKLQKIDGFYTAQGAETETIRSIFLNKEKTTFSSQSIIIGTNSGKVLSAPIVNNIAAKPAFGQLADTQSLIRDMYFINDNSGYILKSEGIYNFKIVGGELTTSPLATVEDLKPDRDSDPRLYTMAFIKGTTRVCVGGAYIVKKSENQIKRQLLLCIKDINDENPKWDKPEMPDDAQIQITNISFSDPTYGLAVGTEGTIWMTDDGGRNWKKQEVKSQNVKVNDAFMSGFALGTNKAWAVGYSSQVWFKPVNVTATATTTTTTTTTRPTAVITADGEEYKVGDIVEIKGKVFEELGISINKKMIGRVTKVFKEARKLKVTLVSADLSEAIRKLINEYLDGKELGYEDVEKVPNGSSQSTQRDSGINTGSTTQSQSSKNDVTEWKKKAIPVKKDVILRNVKFATSDANEKIGWIVGDSGTILYTDNGGNTWKSVVSTLAVKDKAIFDKTHFYSIFVDGSICWIGGSNGVVVRINF